MHIGTGWNKNLKNVVFALQKLKHLNFVLTIVGKLQEDQEKMLLESGIKYTNKINLNDQQIYNEYCLSHIISFPSFYEGFGMPIIEGQKVGRPIITSNIEPLKEVANDSVLFVNPNDVNSIKMGFEKLLTDPEFRDLLILKGRENVKRFSSYFIASQYIKIYARLGK